MNEWLKVMLGEIERKKAEHEVAVQEQRARAEDGAAATSDGETPVATADGTPTV